MPREHPFYDTEHLDVEFFMQPKKDRAASIAEGRPIYKDKEMVRFSIIGDPTRNHVGPAHEKYIQPPKSRSLTRRSRPEEDDDEPRDDHLTYAEHFKDAYAAFKAGVVDFNSGTPLEMLPFLSRSRIAEYHARNVRTVEGLVQLPDRLITDSGPATRGEIELARAWIDNASAANSVALANSEKLALQKQLDDMAAQIAALKQAPAQVATDDPATWTKEALLAFMRDSGRSARANASHDNLVAAVRAIMAGAEEAQVVAEEEVD